MSFRKGQRKRGQRPEDRSVHSQRSPWRPGSLGTALNMVEDAVQLEETLLDLLTFSSLIDGLTPPPRHPVCGWVCSLLCLLIRLSESSDSRPRNKSRVVPFPNEFEWKLMVKSGTTPREDTGEPPSWVCKEPRTWGGTPVYAVSRSLHHHVILNSWTCFTGNWFSLCLSVLVLWLSHKNVRPWQTKTPRWFRQSLIVLTLLMV